MASLSLSSGNARFCSQTVSQKALLLFIFRFSAKRRVEWVWASEWLRGGREGGGDCHCRISERGEGTRKRFFFPLSVALGRLAKGEEEEEEEEERIRIRSKGGNGGKEETREPWNQKQMMPPAAASEAYSVGRKEDEDEEALDGAVTEAAQQPSKGGGVFRRCGRRM